jgi:predicted alpha/beta hydrolase family esterase
MGSAGATKKHVLFVHGGGERVREADKKKLAAGLRDALGAAFGVRYPEMPHADRPGYESWKDRVAQELAALDGGVIFVGHSLGAAVLVEYLSEEVVERSVTGIFLVAAPFWGAEDWEVDEYELRKDFASKLPDGLPMFFYRGRDDEVVPFEHLAMYAERLPRAAFRGFDGRGHQFGDDLSEVVRDIERTSNTPASPKAPTTREETP